MIEGAKPTCLRPRFGVQGRSEWTPTIMASWRGSQTINSLYSYSHIGNTTNKKLPKAGVISRGSGDHHRKLRIPNRVRRERYKYTTGGTRAKDNNRIQGVWFFFFRASRIRR